VKLLTRIASSLLLAAVAMTAALPVHAADAASGLVVRGEVLEFQNVGSYTYLRLKTKDGDTWAAVPATAVKKGAVVTVGNAEMMYDFESQTLKRTFAKIVFGQVIDPNPAPASSSAAAPPAVLNVAKAIGPDAHTVAEVVRGKTVLKGKTVLVRGQVVKVNTGILGKNWVHLQDGSGSPADGTNDILVVTKNVAAIGDVVTTKGTVRTDVKLGAGYAFAVLIEDAEVSK